MKVKKTEKASVIVRHNYIRELLKTQQQVSNTDLAKMFNVSEMTIRRDLEKLETDGQIRRTHGGAVIAERMVFEFDFATRRHSHCSEKRAIAREAFKLVQPGHRILLDTGTTTLELAYLMKSCEDITVITLSLAVVSVLQFAPGVKTILTGGYVRPSSPTLSGGMTEIMLDMFAADISFQGVDGIGLDGTLYAADVQMIGVDRKIRQQSEQSFILADSSKIGKTALVATGNLREVDALITDNKIRDKDREALEKTNTKIIVVHPKG